MIIMGPVITEKSMLAARGGIFTFHVVVDSTKHQVKHAVEEMFSVKVTRVNISLRHLPAKHTGAKRLSGNDGRAKYATVKLVAGQKIDLFDLKEEK